MSKKGTTKRQTYKIVLCIALVMMLLGSYLASVIQSDFGSVSVEEITIATGKDQHISALLLIPENATADNPAPLIVTSHGSYNNKEIQDQNYTEWARRGFVVISMDAYNHGSSSMGDTNKGMIDVIEYAYNTFDYIDKEKIGISGHSMGGMISNATLQHYVGQEALGLGPNKIAAVLYVGADASYTGYEIEGVEGIVYPDASIGIICGKYDEWFFRAEDTNYNPTLFLESNNAKLFVDQVGADLSGNVESGKLYWGEHEGEAQLRAIWQPEEIHPKNHFSADSATAGSTFFYEALGTPVGAQYIEPTSQVWQWKEFFNFIGLIGAFLFLYPFACLLMETPYFGKLKAARAPARLPAMKTGKDKAVFWGTYAINLVLPALLVIPIMFKLIGKSSFVPGTITAWFGEPNTTELAGWTLIVAICIFAVFAISTFAFNKNGKQMVSYWGVKTSFSDFVRSILLGLAVVTVLYVIVFFLHFCFLTDFRIWMIAIKPFTVDKALYAVAYFPAFYLFYLANSVLVEAGNNKENFPNWLVTVLSCFSNIAGIVVLIAIQYIPMVSKGTLKFNSMRIVNLFPLLVLIPAATVIERYFFRKTGKPYVGAAVIAMLYTMFTCANTMFLGSVL